MLYTNTNATAVRSLLNVTPTARDRVGSLPSLGLDAVGRGTADLLAGLRGAADAAKGAERRLNEVRTKRPQFDVKADRLGGHATRYAAGLGNAERNLNLAAKAGDTLEASRVALRGIRDALRAVRDGTGDGSEQATIDRLVGELDANAEADFAGKAIFADDAPPANPVGGEPVKLTDTDGHVLFDKTELTNHGGQHAAGATATPGADPGDGHTRELRIEGNTWKTVALGETISVTDDLYLEVEFKSEGTAEIQGISLENNGGTSSARTLKFDGTQNYGHAVAADGVTADGFGTYRVKVSDYLAQGTAVDRLVFVNDDDGNAGGSGTFRNARLVTATDPVTTPAQPAATGQGTGLDRQVFSGKLGTGDEQLVESDTDTEVHKNWGNGGLGGMKDHFSVRWEGKVQADADGTYQFRTRSDDGVRVWVNGDLQIDNWTDHGPAYDYTQEITLAEGETADIRVEYYEKSGGAVLELEWQRDGGGFGKIDGGLLYNAGDTVPQPTPETTTPGTDTPMTFDGVGVEETNLKAETRRDPVAGGRRFNTGPTLERGFSSGGFGKIAADALGAVEAGDAVVADLTTGGKLDLAALAAGGNVQDALKVVNDALGQVRYQQAGVAAFARSMQADVNVSTFALDIAGKAADRLDRIAEAEQAAEDAKAALKEQADKYRLSLAAANPMNALALLAG